MFYQRNEHQTEVMECGLVSLVIAARMLGREIDIARLKKQYAPSLRGTTLKYLIIVASKEGFIATPIRCSVSDLAHVPPAAILHWRGGHFVVLEAVSARNVRVIDPLTGRKNIPIEKAVKLFSGAALQLRVGLDSPKPRVFGIKKQNGTAAINSLLEYGSISAHMSPHIFLCIFMLCAPRAVIWSFSQIPGINHSTSAKTVVFSVGCVFISVFIINRLILLLLDNRRSVRKRTQLIEYCIDQLFCQNYGWFQARSLGQIFHVSLGISGDHGRWTRAIAFLNAELWMLFGSGMLIITISRTSAWICGGVTITGILILFLLIPYGRILGIQYQQSKIAEHSFRLDTLRAIQSLKSARSHDGVKRKWYKKIRACIVTFEKLAIYKELAKTGVICNSLIYFYLIYNFSISINIQSPWDYLLLIDNIGYSILFIIYLHGALVKTINIALDAPHTVLEKLDRAHRIKTVQTHTCDAERVQFSEKALEIDNVSFRYSPSDPWTLKNLSFAVAKEELIAVVGPAGCGKSTVLKLIAGLNVPTAGSIKLFDRPLHCMAAQKTTHLCGFVSQDDALFAGSIGDNISLFASPPDIPRLWECLELVGLANDVHAMPMKLKTYVGDTGQAVSAGQRQQILLARALYQKPRILLLDEAFCHLNTAAERRIHNQIAHLRLTRIIITQRTESLALADKVVHLANPMATGSRHNYGDRTINGYEH